MATTISLNKLLGTVLVGTYVNSILYTLEVIAAIQYHTLSKRDKRDSRLLQNLVYFELLIDTVSTLTNYAWVYLHTVTHWGDIYFLHNRLWLTPLSFTTVGISETVVQYFLIYRYWVMSKNQYITFILGLLVLAEAGGCVLCIYMGQQTLLHGPKKMVLSAILWCGSTAAVDTSIALSLLWEFNQIKSPFRATQSLIYRLMASTIRTGTVTSVVAILILVLFLIDEESNAYMSGLFCFGRIYGITMIYSLNSRPSHRGSAIANETLSRYAGDTTNMIGEICLHSSVSPGSTTDQSSPGLLGSSKSKQSSGLVVWEPRI